MQSIFKRLPNLRILKFSFKEPKGCSGEQICFPRLDVLNELEQVSVFFKCSGPNQHPHAHHWDFHFPSSLKKLELGGLDLTSDSLSRIARSLPNLESLGLVNAIIQGNEWDMDEVTFENLNSLDLSRVRFSEWQVNGEESFPVLEVLEIYDCDELKEIPKSFGDIASLKSITVCDELLKDSALKIKIYVEEIMGEDKLDVTFFV